MRKRTEHFLALAAILFIWAVMYALTSVIEGTASMAEWNELIKGMFLGACLAVYYLVLVLLTNDD